MTLLKIAAMGHPVLWAEAEPLTFPLATEVRRLAADMVATMQDAPGVGLAAPQVYEPVRLIVVQPERGPDIRPAVLVNPVLTPDGEADSLGIEGCLSIPEWQGIVPRHHRVRCRACDLDGEPIDLLAEGFHARVLQHEVDHLDGILYPMRLIDPRDVAHSSAQRHLLARLERYAGDASR
ncbi:MAG: peptide deformylase [Pseudomonadota bacterium]